MDRYEYIYDSISTYIIGYTTMMVPTNIDSISIITDILGGIFSMAMAIPIGHSFTIEPTRRGEIELNTIFLQEILEQSRVPLM
jgi:hypothetical protein